MHGVPWREVNTGAFFSPPLSLALSRSLPFSLSRSLSTWPRSSPFLAHRARSRLLFFFLPHNKEAVARVDLQRLPVLAAHDNYHRARAHTRARARPAGRPARTLILAAARRCIARARAPVSLPERVNVNLTLAYCKPL